MLTNPLSLLSKPSSPRISGRFKTESGKWRLSFHFPLSAFLSPCLAVRTRLELATPCVTGMYSNQTELPDRFYNPSKTTIVLFLSKAGAKIRTFFKLAKKKCFFDEKNLQLPRNQMYFLCSKTALRPLRRGEKEGVRLVFSPFFAYWLCVKMGCFDVISVISMFYVCAW